MGKWGCAIFMAMVACAGAPAAYADQGDVAFSDACGDNHAYVSVNGVSQEVPATPRTPRFDFKGVKIASVPGGVAVSMTTCEAPGASDGIDGWRGVYTPLSRDCDLAIVAQEPTAPTQPRIPRIIKTCWNGPEKSPIAPIGSDTSDTRFDITLPADAITVNGDTLTLTVKRAGLTGEAAATFAAGTVWSNPFGYAAENYWVAGGGGDTNGNSENFIAPTGIDWAFGPNGTSFVVQ